MSIFRIEANENHVINSRYIQSFDLIIQNLGMEEFDMLIQGSNPHGTTFMYLYHLNVPPTSNSTITIPNIYTNYEAFDLLLVTNINYYYTTAITVQMRSEGNLVAIFTQEDMSRIQ